MCRKTHRVIFSTLVFVLVFEVAVFWLLGYPPVLPNSKDVHAEVARRRTRSRGEGENTDMHAVKEDRSTQRSLHTSSMYVAPRHKHTTVSENSSSARSIDQKLPAERPLLPLYADDAEGPFLADVHQLLRTVRLHTMLDIGSSLSGHMSQIFGHKFHRVVVLATDAGVFNSVKSKVAHPRAEFVHSDIITYGRISHEKFDVVFLNMVLEKLPTREVAPTIQALESLLADEGIGIVSSTHEAEGHGGFYLRAGETVNEEEFNELKNAAPGISRARRWTKSELMQQLRGKQWEITGHVAFTYYTEEYSRRSWEQRYGSLRSTQDGGWRRWLRNPVSQMIAVRRLEAPYSSRFAAPLEPSSASVKDVIFALVRGGKYRSDYDDLVDSRKCIYEALRKNRSGDEATIFDEVYFHEGNVPEPIQRTLKEELPGSRFVDIRPYGAYGGRGNGSGGGIFRWTPWVRLRRPGEYSVGYRHMCRFMSMVWMHALSKYEYAARIDDDVCIHEMIHPFSFLRESHSDYAYALITNEKHEETVETMTPWLDAFVKNHSIAPQKPLNAEHMYFTNFFVTNVSWWLEDSVRLFMHTVDRTGNIYYHRWGDAPLQTAALNIFAEPDRVRWMRVDYSHMSTFNEVRNGTEVTGVKALALKVGPTPKPGPEKGMTSEDMYRINWNKYVAPCLVADYFKLQGAPFKSLTVAVGALRSVLSVPAKAARIDVSEYTNVELASAVQFDVYNSSEPLPTDDVIGTEKRNAMVRLISGHDRKHPEYKDFTFDEWGDIVTFPCFGMATWGFKNGEFKPGQNFQGFMNDLDQRIKQQLRGVFPNSAPIRLGPPGLGRR